MNKTPAAYCMQLGGTYFVIYIPAKTPNIEEQTKAKAAPINTGTGELFFAVKIIV